MSTNNFDVKQRSQIQSVIREMVTPTLIVIIAWFAKAKMDQIDAKIDTIQHLAIEQKALEVRLDRAEKDIATLIAKAVTSPAKQEDEITLSSLVNR
jgi:hypothetical protein